MAKRSPRTRNHGTWTEAAYWGRLRSALRSTFRYWKPGAAALKAAKYGSHYLCARCRKLYPRKAVQIDHITPCGSLRCLDDLAGFLERLTPEDPAAFQVLCVSCHKGKTCEDGKKAT